jgi:hypothetical protein
MTTVVADVVGIDLERGPLGVRGRQRDDAAQLGMHNEYVAPERRVGMQRRARAEHVRNRQDREVVLREREAFRLGVHDVDAERREQAQDANRLGRSRRVVVARDHDDDRVGKLAHEPRELREGEEDRRIRRSHVVEHVAGDDDEVRLDLDDPVDRVLENRRDVSLPLVDAGGGLTQELAVA